MGTIKSISKAGFAKKLGVSKARITAYCQKGMPVLASGLLDESVAREWVRKSILPKPEPGTSDGARLVNVRTAHELVRVRLDQLDLEQRQGKLVNLDEVSRGWVGKITEARNAFLAIEGKGRVRFGEEVGAWLKAEIRKILYELSGTSEEQQMADLLRDAGRATQS
jgi:hypothetical protein